MLKKPTNRHFTEAARAAAKIARQLEKEQARVPNRPEVFAVRDTSDAHSFEWQIRRFGGVVLDTSMTRFASVCQAVADIRQLQKCEAVHRLTVKRRFNVSLTGSSIPAAQSAGRQAVRTSNEQA